jgi:hypothetical protein
MHGENAHVVVMGAMETLRDCNVHQEAEVSMLLGRFNTEHTSPERRIRVHFQAATAGTDQTLRYVLPVEYTSTPDV